MKYSWVKPFPAAITVCDTRGIILEMNDIAIDTFKNDGGEKLVGKNLLDCHPTPAHSILEKMLKEQKPNSYTIEKKGIKKLIYQTPWYENGTYAGFVEISFPIPFEMPHFVRT
jgi:hypothetical protein